MKIPHFPRFIWKKAVTLSSQSWTNLEERLRYHVRQLKRLAQTGLTSDSKEIDEHIRLLLALWLIGTAPCAHPDLKEFFQARKAFFDRLKSIVRRPVNMSQMRAELLDAIPLVEKFDIPPHWYSC